MPKKLVTAFKLILLQKYKHKERSEEKYGQKAVHLAVKNFPEPKSPELHISQNNQSQK